MAIDPGTAYVAGAGLSYLGGMSAQNLSGKSIGQMREHQEQMAQGQREWEEQMYRTRYRLQVEDLKGAGLNPMLAYGQSPGGVPGGPGTGHDTAQQYENIIGNAVGAASSAGDLFMKDAQAKNIKADTERKEAERKEIEARTPTYAISMDAMRAQIAHTTADIERVISQTNLNVSSSAQNEQQILNLKALVPQIEATVHQLRAQVKLTGAQTEQAKAHTSEVTQRIQANLPAAEAALLKVQEALRQLERPQMGMRAATYSTPIGAFSEMMNALRRAIPFAGN